jgi:hypothetical protein
MLVHWPTQPDPSPIPLFFTLGHTDLPVIPYYLLKLDNLPVDIPVKCDLFSSDSCLNTTLYEKVSFALYKVALLLTPTVSTSLKFYIYPYSIYHNLL